MDRLYVNTYNPSVRIGNWNEEIVFEEDTLKDFLEKKEKGELMVQKTFEFMTAMRKKIELSVSSDYAIHIGDQVLIKCLGTDPRAVPNNSWRGSGVPRQECVVAVHITDRSELLRKNVSAPLLASAATQVEPNQRTVFTIESVEGGMKGYKVRHGQAFYLCTASPDIGKLYLTSDRATFTKYATKSKHQQVYFTAQPSYLAHWMLLHKNPRLRLEYENLPVEANEECVLVHCKTNRCLAVEPDCLYITPFGKDYEVSTHTYLDSHKVEMDANRWVLVVGVPGSSVEPVPHQPALGKLQ